MSLSFRKINFLILICCLAFENIFAQATSDKPAYICNTILCRIRNMGGSYFPSESPNRKPETSIEKSSQEESGISSKSMKETPGLDEGFELLSEKHFKFDCGEDNKNCKFKPTKIAEGTDMITKKSSDIILDNKQSSGWKTCIQKGKVDTLQKQKFFANKIKKNKATGKWEGVNPKVLKPGEDGQANSVLDCI